jgi:glycosyltransferase involved in cell wall biosynthesis
MSLISVIVPVYNVKKYLNKCIDSLLGQSISDYEIILVDDGSTDGSGQLCDEISKKSDRIHVYHKPNGGLSDARNYGIEYAKGDYITFVDSDDYVSKDYLKILSDMFENDIDIAMVSIQEILENEIPKCTKSIVSVVTAEEAVRKMLLREGGTHCSVGKLYRKAFWKEYRFPKGRLYEDYLTTYYVFSKAKKVAIDCIQPYFYVQRPESIMHYKCSEKTLSILDASDQITKFICSFWPKLKYAAIDLQIASYMKCMQSILNSGFECFPDAQKRIIQKNRKIFLKYIFFPILMKEKIKVVSLCLGRRFFIHLYNRNDGSKKV